MSANWDSGGGGGTLTPQVSFPPVTPVVKKLLILNFGIYLATVLLFLASESAYLGVMRYLGVRPDSWIVGPPYFPFWQPVTYGFLHSRDPMHVIGNMIGVYFFGTLVESTIGSRRFLVTYFAAMFAGAALHFAVEAFRTPSSFLVGASGAALGVVVVAAVLQPNSRVLLLFIPVQLKWIAIGYVGINIVMALQSFKVDTGGTAFFAHLGGAAYGFFAARSRLIWKDPLADWQQRRESRAAQQRQDEDLRMDDLLAKIHKEGMSSLTRREKAFLKKVSERQ